MGALAPGRYVAAAFAAPFTFEVGRGWRAYAHEPDLVTLGRERGGVPEGMIPFRVVEEVYDPETSEVVPAPAQLERWLRRHPGLDVASVRPAELGGLPGAAVRMQASPSAPRERGCAGPCVRVAPPAGGAGDTGLVVERTATELAVLPLPDARIVTVHVAPVSSSFRVEATRLLPTVRFELES